MHFLKSSKFVAVIVAVVALVWIGSGLFFHEPHPADQANTSVEGALDSAEQDKPLQDVRVRDMTAELYADDIVVTGRTQASKNVVLRAESSGQVQEILKEEGARVSKDEALAKIEIRDRQAKVKETQERVNQRQIEYNAAKKLENKGFNSKVRLAQTLADLEQAKAELRLSQVDQAKTKINAPFDGIIYEQAAEIGDYLSVGDSIFTIVDLDPIELVGYVSERRIQDINDGGPAFAEFLDGQGLKGVISYISPAADPQTRTFRVIMTASNSDLSVKEGLTAKIRIPLAQREAHKISPSILTLNDAGQIGVKIVNAQDIVEFVPVQILADKPGAMWISGPPQQARFITVGQEFVLEGQKVHPVQAEGDGLL